MNWSVDVSSVTHESVEWRLLVCTIHVAMLTRALTVILLL